jgi:hypothetical protein
LLTHSLSTRIYIHMKKTRAAFQTLKSHPSVRIINRSKDHSSKERWHLTRLINAREESVLQIVGNEGMKVATLIIYITRRAAVIIH